MLGVLKYFEKYFVNMSGYAYLPTTHLLSPNSILFNLFWLLDIEKEKELTHRCR